MTAATVAEDEAERVHDGARVGLGERAAGRRADPLSRGFTSGRSAVCLLALTSLLSSIVAACGGVAGRMPPDSGREAVPQPSPPADSAPGATVPLGAGTVYTADERGGSVSRVDLATGRVTTLPIGLSPHNVQLSPDGRRVFVVGSLPGEGPGQLLILDAAATDTAGATRVGIGREPAHVILDLSGARAYATSEEENAVFVVDVAQQRVVDTIPTAASPHAPGRAGNLRRGDGGRRGFRARRDEWP